MFYAKFGVCTYLLYSDSTPVKLSSLNLQFEFYFPNWIISGIFAGPAFSLSTVLEQLAGDAPTTG
jgi:hypothetical protein